VQALRDILYGVALLEVLGDNSINIRQIAFDSREVQHHDLFVAIKGNAVDGHLYVEKAILSGAVAIVCEELPKEINPKIVYLKVKNSQTALSILAKNFYDNPSDKINLIGVTGTNGKSTICTLLYQLFSNLGYHCGLISTIEYKVGDKVYDATHTTPNVLHLNQLLHQMSEAGCAYCFMEVSSHAMVQQRVNGITFTGGVFTNLSHDHLDYHKTFDEYLAAKKLFFDGLPKTAFALSNIDDKRGKVMLQNTAAKTYTYGIKNLADFKGRVIENSLTGLLLNFDDTEVNTLLVGEFNAYNLLAVYATALLLEANREEILNEISRLRAAEGRFDHIYDQANQIVGIIDYAHTPDALKNVLETINKIRTGNETVITVVGAGGDRDKTKRPQMAAIACALSNKVILTSDNPRSEEMDAIIDDMMEGLSPADRKKVVRITDRKEAIRMARYVAKQGDIIGIFGKGHEKYQEIENVKYPFDDKQILLETFKNFAG